jgi:hypothetical protein
MSDQSELRYQRWQIEQRGPTEGWEAVATEVIQFDAEHTEPKPSDETIDTKIAEVGSFVGRVLAHIDEPTVFQSRSEDFLHFSTVIPDPVNTFSFGNKVPAIYLEGSSKLLGYTSMFAVPGSRDIVARIDDKDPYMSVWMVPGARSEYTNIPFFTESKTENVAVGGKEIADLFTGLRGTSDAYNGRLFGALMHIAWLADDFDVKIPIVTSFIPEAKKATIGLDIEDQAAEGNTFVLSSVVNSLGTDIDSLILESIRSKRIEGIGSETSADVVLPRLANGPPGESTGHHALINATSVLERTLETLRRIEKNEKEEQRGRNRQRKLVNALMGFSG